MNAMKDVGLSSGNASEFCSTELQLLILSIRFVSHVHTCFLTSEFNHPPFYYNLFPEEIGAKRMSDDYEKFKYSSQQPNPNPKPIITC